MQIYINLNFKTTQNKPKYQRHYFVECKKKTYFAIELLQAYNDKNNFSFHAFGRLWQLTSHVRND